MKLICIEEHAVDAGITRAAQPVLDSEAPYMSAQSTVGATSRPAGRQTVVEMRQALRMAADLGEGRLKDMDEHGIDVQVVSYSSPAQLAPESEGVELTRAANDRLAAAVAAHPDRLQGFAVLPWQAPAAAADELERSVRELGLKGALIVGRPGPGETFLDDAKYEPVLAKLAELGVPLYLHPFHPAPTVQRVYYAGLPASAEFSLGGWGWHHEAGIHLLRLILAGVFERIPALQVISGHWGELVPFYLARLDQAMPPAVTGLSRTITETYREHVWVTPSGIFTEPHVAFVRDTVGFDRVIWSVDYPYVTMTGTREFLDGLSLGEADLAKITHQNAEKLFGL